jgi:hypothetical protein
MSNVVREWVKVARNTLEFLFGGSEAGTNALAMLINEGREYFTLAARGSGSPAPANPGEPG